MGFKELQNPRFQNGRASHWLSLREVLQGYSAFHCIVLWTCARELAGGKCQCHSIMYQSKTTEGYELKPE